MYIFFFVDDKVNPLHTLDYLSDNPLNSTLCSNGSYDNVFHELFILSVFHQFDVEDLPLGTKHMSFVRYYLRDGIYLLDSGLSLGFLSASSGCIQFTILAIRFYFVSIYTYVNRYEG